MTTATAIYRSIMLEIERRRLALGMPHWQVNDAAGTQDGYFAKMMLPDTPSGRQASWETLQLVIDALFPDGFEVIIRPTKDGALSADDQRRKMRFATAHTNPRTQRELMRELRLQALARMTPQQRAESARKAGKASGKSRRARSRERRLRKRNEGVGSGGNERLGSAEVCS